MSLFEIVAEIFIIVACGALGALVLARPDLVWRAGRRLSLCRGERPGRTYRSTVWIVGVVFVAVALIHLVTTALQLTM